MLPLDVILTDPICADMFQHDAVDKVGGLVKTIYLRYINTLEDLRQHYCETSDVRYRDALLEMMPLMDLRYTAKRGDSNDA